MYVVLNNQTYPLNQNLSRNMPKSYESNMCVYYIEANKATK